MINFLFNFSLIITYLTYRGGICFLPDVFSLGEVLRAAL